MGWIGYRQDVTQRGQNKLSGAGIGCYIGGEKTYDERSLRSYDWEYRQDILDKGIIAPEDAPDWAKTMAAGQNLHEFGKFLEDEEDRYLERYHHAKGTAYITDLKSRAVTDFRVQLDLPIELNREQAIALAREYVREAYARSGMMVAYAVHWDPHNPHLHVFGSTRKLTAKGFGSRLKAFNRYGEREEELVRFRETYARIANRHLVEAGFTARLDHRSYEEQGIGLVPTVHEGAAARGRAERGLSSDVVEMNEERRQENIRRLTEDPEAVIRSVSRMSAAFSEGQLKAELFRMTGGDEAAFEAIAPKLMVHPLLHRVGEDGRGATWYTTAANKAVEAEFRQLTDRLATAVREETVNLNAASLLVFNKFPHLRTDESKGQREALTEVLLAPRLTVVEGRAGVGKTTMFAAANAVYQQQGFTVRGFAMAGAAADNLQEETGIGSRTLESFSVQVKRLAELEARAEDLRQTFRPKLTVAPKVDARPRIFLRSPIFGSLRSGLRFVNPVGLKLKPKVFLNPKIVNEAERELKRVEAQIERLRAEVTFTSRTVVVVDEAGMAGTEQLLPLLRAVEAGGAKLVLVGDSHQFKAIAQGDAFRYASSVAVSRSVIDKIRRQEQAWQKAATADLSEKRVREGLQPYIDHGRFKEASTDEGAARALVSSYLARRAEGQTGVNDQLMLAFTHKDVEVLNALVRERLKASGEIRDVVSVAGREFGVGDRIVFTVNRAASSDLVDLSGQGVRVRNGTVGMITGIEGEGAALTFRMRLGSRDDEVKVTASAYAQEMVHGFATTFHKAQGQTVNYSYLLASDMPRDDAAYVSLTRHRQDTEIHWSKDRFESLDDLVRRWERPAYKALLKDFERQSDDPQSILPVQRYVNARMEAGRLGALIQADVDKGVTSFFEHPMSGAFLVHVETRRKLAEEILEKWAEYELPLQQVGLTQARVREDMTRKVRKPEEEAVARPDVEKMLARYAELNRQARESYGVLKADVSPAAMKLDPRYKEFAALRDERGALAAEMLKGGAVFRRAAATQGVSWQGVKTQASDWRVRQAQARSMETLKAADGALFEMVNRYRNGRVIAAGLKTQGGSGTPEYYRLLAENEKRAAQILDRWEQVEVNVTRLGLNDRLLKMHAARGEVRYAIEHLVRQSGEARLLAGVSLQAKLNRLPGTYEKFAAAVAKSHGLNWRQFRKTLPAGRPEGGQPEFAVLFRAMSHKERSIFIREYRQHVLGLDELERGRALRLVANALSDVRQGMLRQRLKRQPDLPTLQYQESLAKLQRMAREVEARRQQQAAASAQVQQAAAASKSPIPSVKPAAGVTEAPKLTEAAKAFEAVGERMVYARQMLGLAQMAAGGQDQKTAEDGAREVIKGAVKLVVRAVLKI
jgi:ATP-dependent exoDNAse (exonuclease V) alpha subunit